MFKEKELNGRSEKAAGKTLSTAFDTKHLASYSQLLPAAVFFLFSLRVFRFRDSYQMRLYYPFFFESGGGRRKFVQGRILVAEFLFCRHKFYSPEMNPS